MRTSLKVTKYTEADLELVTLKWLEELGCSIIGGPEYKRNRLGMLLVEHGAGAKIPQDYKEAILK